jgi:hypothetical protein
MSILIPDETMPSPYGLHLAELAYFMVGVLPSEVDAIRGIRQTLDKIIENARGTAVDAGFQVLGTTLTIVQHYLDAHALSCATKRRMVAPSPPPPPTRVEHNVNS